MPNDILTLTCYSGNKRTEDVRVFRTPANVAEMVSHCDSHSHIWFRSTQGDARQAKINGKVRTWKRDASRIEVPLKYGLYEYGTLTASDIDRVLIPVSSVGKCGTCTVALYESDSIEELHGKKYHAGNCLNTALGSMGQ